MDAPRVAPRAIRFEVEPLGDGTAPTYTRQAVPIAVQKGDKELGDVVMKGRRLAPPRRIEALTSV